MGFGDIAAHNNGNDAVKNAIKDGLSNLKDKGTDKFLGTKLGRGSSKAQKLYRTTRQRSARGECLHCGEKLPRRKKGFGYCNDSHKMKAVEAILAAAEND